MSSLATVDSLPQKGCQCNDMPTSTPPFPQSLALRALGLLPRCSVIPPQSIPCPGLCPLSKHRYASALVHTCNPSTLGN